MPDGDALQVEREVRRRPGGGWEVVAHLNPVWRPALEAGEFITRLTACRLFGGPALVVQGRLQAAFRLEWVYDRGVPFRPPTPATGQLLIVVAAPVPEEARHRRWLPHPRSCVQGAAVGPQRNDLRAAVTLVVGCGPP